MTTLSPEQRKERQEAGKAKAAAALAKLDEMVERIAADDESFAEYLRLSGRLHSYSWGNRLLMMLQRPDVQMVAGYNDWRDKHDRPVKKGSKGLQILAPMVVKDREAEDEDARKVVGFRCVYVFDVRDTEGPEIALPTPAPLTDDGPAARAALAELENAARRFGIPVSHETQDELDAVIPGCGGYYMPAENRIGVLADQPAASTASTLAHELAHAIARRDGKHGKRRRDHETVAEGAAFVVMATLGIDTSAHAAPYVASWAGSDGYIARVKELLQNIAEVAQEIVNKPYSTAG